MRLECYKLVKHLLGEKQYEPFKMIWQVKRMYIILVYDIKVDEKGQKILNNVFKVCKRYLCHIQNSVFEGELSEGQIVK